MVESAARGAIVDGAAEAGVDPDGLRRVFGLVEDWIAAGVLPGVAALVARGGRIAGEAYLGLADRRNGRPVDADTIWALASITKPVTTTAILLLVERDLVSLDEPLANLVPEFLRAPDTGFDRRAVTLRHLLTHTAGLPGFSEDNLDLRRAHRPLDDFVRSFARQPLLFAPGALHYYSNAGIALAAEAVGGALTGHVGEELIEPAIGAYHAFVRDAILVPLGMTDSAIPALPEWDERIAWVEDTGQAGMDWEMANSAYYRGLGIPWGGLFSRPRDLARFVDVFLPQAIGRRRLGLDAGAAGQRLVAPATARAMTTVQAAPPDAPADLAPELRDGDPPAFSRPAVPWGLGWAVKGAQRSHPSGDLTSADTFGHGGATGTLVWADPREDVACVLLTNRATRAGWGGDRPRQALFGNAVMAALR